jgi:hypothetical protein
VATAKQSLARRLGAGVALALLAGLLLAPSAAQAGCGDYVVFGMKHADAQTLSSPFAPVAHPAPVSPTDNPTPCSGPTCSSGPATPPAAPAPPGPVPGERCGFPSTLPLWTGPEAVVYRTDDSAGTPVRGSSTIYHPPR